MRTILALWWLAVAPTGWADEPEDAVSPEVLSSLASEYAQCASFYLLTANGFKNAERPDAAARFLSLADHALKMAATFSNEKRALAETELYRKLMMKEIENDLANLGVLANQHLLPCNEVIENPDARIEYWVEHFMGERGP